MIDIRIFFIMTFWILEYLSYVIQEATVSSLADVLLSDKLGTKKPQVND